MAKWRTKMGISEKERLEELRVLFNETMLEKNELSRKIRCEENKLKIDHIYKIPFPIHIVERDYSCLFKVLSVDDFGTLMGTLLGVTHEFGKRGYIITDHWFDSTQLGEKLLNPDSWNGILFQMKEWSKVHVG